MQLIVHRGSHEVGGSCVELVTGSTRIILDVGVPLVDAAGDPLDVRTLRGKGARDLMAERVLPRVSGLFHDGPSLQAIMLSHAHTDHAGLLKYARLDIPVYASRGTSKMMLAGSIFTGQVRLDRSRHREVRDSESFTVGEFEITAHAVDHSAFDSMAFLIRARGKRLLYSGDLRLHGRKPGMARRLVEAARREPVDGDFLALAAEPGGQSGQFAPQRRRVARQQPQRNT
ncbi:MAG: MBL fold metallo-hydrolase [Isosphaeraceae bacterium]